MDKTIKQQLVEVSRLMYEKGMVNAFEGNVSIKNTERIYITPSGICKGLLTEEMIAITDMQGNIIEGLYRPSSEIKLHIAAYRYRNEITSVVHTHSPYATAYAIANKPIETKAYPEMIVLYGKIPLAAYGTPSTEEICRGVEIHLKEYDVILLANHGVLAVGTDAYDAFFKMESVESIAKTLTIAEQLGGVKELDESKLQELFEMRRKRKEENNKNIEICK